MVKISRTAAKMIRQAAKQKGWDMDECYLRIYIDNNMAQLDIVQYSDPLDEEYKSKGIYVIIDKIANTWLSTSKIDYEDHGDGVAGFTVDAPDLPVAGSAGCGSCVGDFGCC